MLKKIYKNFIPKFLKEKSKEIYYNLISPESFLKYKNFYRTTYKNGIVLNTYLPLYSVVKDIRKYEKYYEVKEGDIVLDAGANDASISLYFSQKVKKNGIIYSIEPDTRNIELIKNNIELNELDDNIIICNDLLWDECSEIIFHEQGSVGSSIHFKGKKAKSVLKTTTTLDKFIELKEINKVDFIKMDIEGAEIEALEGAKQMIKKFKPKFSIASYHIIKGERTYIKVENFFKRENYPYKTIFFDDGEIITYAG